MTALYGSQKGRKGAIWYNRHGKSPVAPCHWCQKKLRFRETTIDHVVPRWRGGGNEWSNLVLACAGCNQQRGIEDQIVAEAHEQEVRHAGDLQGWYVVRLQRNDRLRWLGHILGRRDRPLIVSDRCKATRFPESVAITQASWVSSDNLRYLRAFEWVVSIELGRLP